LRSVAHIRVTAWRPSPDAVLADHPRDPLAADGLTLGPPLGIDARGAMSFPGVSMNPLGLAQSPRLAILRGLLGGDRQAQQLDGGAFGASHMTRAGQTPR
jgi:hypothetical protein